MASVPLPVGNDSWRLLARLGGGAVFGEMPAIDRGVRSSDISAETDVSCLAISLSQYDAMTGTDAVLKSRLLKYLLAVLTSTLRSANEQIAALAV